MKPPKCRTCGKEEWQHTCGPTNLVGMQISAGVTAFKRRGEMVPVSGQITIVAPKPKPDRKEYLKFKARNRRARQKEPTP